MRTTPPIQVFRALVILLAGIGCSMVMTRPALGVTALKGQKDGANIGVVATAAATKAQREVQIRRLKNLLVSRKTKNTEATFEALEKLQKNLRGEN